MHKRTMALTILRAVALALICVVVVASCSGISEWYPSGDVSVAGSYEYEDAGVRWLALTVTVRNTGSSTITLSTFTVAAETGVRTYWKTVTSNTRVLPGASIKVVMALSYANASETLKADGVTVGENFFE